MAMGDLTCPACNFHWLVWRQYQETLDDVIKLGCVCPQCGHKGGIVKQTYTNVVHFKGGGWTPKSGTENDLRELEGVPDAVRKELD